MQTIHSLLTRRALGAACKAALSLGTLGLGATAWAQQPPSQPAPVPGAGEAAAAAGVSGSGATTGAGSNPTSATTMMKATDTQASSTPKTAKQSAKERRRTIAEGAIEPWLGRRVLLLLPLQLGPGFNADRAFGNAILSQGRAEALLQQQLEATGKFSVVRAHRFSPLIQRGLQEKRLTEAQAEEIIKTPSVGSATTFLQQYTFDQLPMIGQFALEEVRGGGTSTRPSVQAQVSGRLYELNNPIPLKSPVLTSNAAARGRNNIERYLEAVRDGFGAVAAEMTAPLEDVALPTPEPRVPAPTGGDAATTATGAPASTEATMNAATPAATTPEPVAPATPAEAPVEAPAAAPAGGGAVAPGTQ